MKRTTYISGTNSVGARLVFGPYTKRGAKREATILRAQAHDWNPRLIAKRGRTRSEIYESIEQPKQRIARKRRATRRKRKSEREALEREKRITKEIIEEPEEAREFAGAFDSPGKKKRKR